MKKIYSLRYRLILCLLSALILLAMDILLTPSLVVIIDGRPAMIRPAVTKGYPFSIHFIHSVQKTPVAEFLVTTEQGFCLERTEYQSFGVGLPFLAEEGRFRQQGDLFILEGINRHFSSLSLRNSIGTKLTLCFPERIIKVHEIYSPGARIDLYLMPISRLLANNSL